jgi:hypothetical protein
MLAESRVQFDAHTEQHRRPRESGRHATVIPGHRAAMNPEI